MSSNSHHTDHIVVANSHDRHDPVPRLAPFSGRVATAIGGLGTTTAHQQKQVVEQLAHNNKVIAILLQETHCTNPDFLAIAGYEVCAFTTSKYHGIATFVSQDATWSTVARSYSNSEIEWLAIRIDGMTIVNIYKPPPTRLTPTLLPSFGNQCIYAGYFNCQHCEWGYHICSADGDALTARASAKYITLLYDPEETASFHSQRWNSDTNPDLAFDRCQPSRNRAGNPAFWLISRIPAFLSERPAFLALFRNNKNR